MLLILLAQRASADDGPLLPSPAGEGSLEWTDPADFLPGEQYADAELIPPPAAVVDEPFFPAAAELHVLDEPAPAYSSGEWIFTGGWYFYEDVVVMQKAQLDEQLVAFDGVNPTLTLSTASDTPTFEPGARITFGKIYGRDVWDRDHMVEVRYFGLLDWISQARIVRTSPVAGDTINTLLGPNADDVAALFGNRSQRYVERSSLDSFDINVRMRTRSTRDRMVLQHDGSWIRHQTRSRIWSCYTGFTSFFVDEQFDLLGVTPGEGFGRFIVSTDNEMYGVHFGGEYIEQSALWNWGFRGRLGGLANFAQRQSSFTSQLDPAATPTTRSETRDKDNLTFLIEGGVFASLQIHPNATLRVSYDVLCLTGIAEATGNFELPVGSFSPMEVNDAALYHGGSIGFTMVW